MVPAIAQLYSSCAYVCPRTVAVACERLQSYEDPYNQDDVCADDGHGNEVQDTEVAAVGEHKPI